eukprot:GFUD01030325.1.p1 GENE.GFUD01030325.1~~GFUD01030325.1.p1  ORF type:complete len:546 (+),score=126.14 GFUD01030325.1:93-1730(+)
MELIPGTVCCILCRGLVIYKNGDKSRFKAHLSHEHGAFFDTDYLLASCLMGAEQKAEVAKTLDVVQMDTKNSLDLGESLQEGTDEKSKFVCGSCATHFTAKTAYLQHITKGCKKEALKTGYNCESCDKSYSTRGNLTLHVGKKHGQESIKKEKVNQEETLAEPFDQRFYQNHETLVSEMSVSRNESEIDLANLNQEEVAYKQSQDLSPNITDFEQASAIVTNTSDQLYADLEKSAKKQFSCYICTKAFGSSLYLAKHMTKKHSGQETGDISLNEGVDEGSKSTSGVKLTKEFVCMFQPCTKSYSSNESRGMHERKAHNRPPLKRGRSKKEVPNQFSNVGASFNEGYPQEEYPTNYPATYPSEFSDSSMDESETVSVENSLSSSFLTDTSLDFDSSAPEDDIISQCDSQTDISGELSDFDDKNEESSDQIQTQITRQILDLNKSKYFVKNPNVIANARGKSVKLFDEEAKHLPDGWKMRTIEMKKKNGDMSSIKHFLTPDTKVLKTGLAVVEYLRLEGVFNTDQILEISNKLNVSEKKLRNLYMSD